MPHPSRLPVSLDSLGGALLNELDAGHWRCHQESLACLDVRNCSRLEVLDLREAASDMHLTVQECPVLQEILLPASGKAVVHVDFGDSSPRMVLRGGLQSVDACWQGGTFALACGDLSPWKCAAIGDAAFVGSVEGCSELQVVTGGVSPAEGKGETFIVDDDQVRTLLLQDFEHLTAIETTPRTERLEQLFVKAMPALDTVRLGRRILKVEVREAERLHKIEGSIESLSLNQAGAFKGELKISGRCRLVQLVASPVAALRMAHPTDLTLMYCYRLKEVTLPKATRIDCIGHLPTALTGQLRARVRIDESLARSLVERHRRGEAGVEQQLEQLLPAMHQRVAAARALPLLWQLLEQGADPHWVWQLRRELSARHLMSRHPVHQPLSESTLEAADALWQWDLPHDLHREAWLADYRLFLACCEADRHIWRYRHSMLAACAADLKGPASQTLLEHFSRHPGQPPEREIQLMTRLLRKLRNVVRRHASWHYNAIVRHQVRWQERHFGQLGEDYDHALVGYAMEGMALDDFLELAERLGAEHPAIQQALTRVLRQSSRWLNLHCGNTTRSDPAPRLERARRLLATRNVVG